MTKKENKKNLVSGTFLILLLFLSLLTGCSEKKNQKDTKSTSQGRYVEQQIASIENANQVMGLYLTEDKNLIFYFSCFEEGNTILKRCMLSSESGELSQIPMAWFHGLGNILDISEAEDGTIYLITTDETFQENIYQIKDGTTEIVSLSDTTQLEKNEKNPSQLCGIRSLPGGDFLLLYGNNGISHYRGTDASLLKKYPVIGYNWNVDIYNGKLLALGLGKNEILSYDLNSGEQEQTISFNNLSFSALQGMDKTGIYVTDTTGIYRQNHGEHTWNKLVNGDLTSLSLPSIAIEGVISDGSDGFFAIFSSEKNLHLVHYIYDSNIKAVPDTTLTIFSLKDNPTIRQAIGIFQQQNPNVWVEFQTISDEASSANTEDVIRSLNTKLLNGDGPDILLLDGLPVKSYMEKGVLVDLTAQINTLAENSLMKNLINAYEYEECYYGIPSRFTIPVMVGEKDTLESIHSLDDLMIYVEANHNQETPFLTPSPYLFENEGILMDYYDVCSTNFIGTDGIDKTALSLYLSNMLRIQQIQEANISKTNNDIVSGEVELFELMGISTPIEDNNELFYIQELTGKNAVSISPFNLKFTLKPFFGGTYYTPRWAVGITRTSKHQELSWQFVELLLSQTVQDIYLYDGFPVNSQSLNKIITDTMKNQKNDIGLWTICNQLETPILVDQVIKEAVQSQVHALLDGTITPENAASAIIEKTKLYLME